MRKEFSVAWKGSKQPRKQRKYRAKAPINVRQKMLSSNLSKDLRKKYSRKSIQLRKGDNIKVMRGEFYGKGGKVSSLDMRRLKVIIEGLQKTKKDGTKTNVVFDPSNLQVQELDLDDKERLASLKRKENKEITK